MGAILAGGVPAGIYATSTPSVSAVVDDENLVCVWGGVDNRRKTEYLLDIEMLIMTWLVGFLRYRHPIKDYYCCLPAIIRIINNENSFFKCRPVTSFLPTLKRKW